MSKAPEPSFIQRTFSPNRVFRGVKIYPKRILDLSQTNPNFSVDRMPFRSSSPLIESRPSIGNEFIKLGPIEYRQGRYADPVVRALGLRRAHLHAHVWRNVDSTDAKPQGVGYPIVARDGTVVNFLQMRPSESTFEESHIPGYPIARCKVVFGTERTKEILVTVDCCTALALHLATNWQTVAVLYGDNQIDECKYQKRTYPDSIVKVCVNDSGTDEDSTALHDARKAADAIGAAVFASGPFSFAELYRKKGYEGVQQRLAEPCQQYSWDQNRTYKQLKIATRPIPWPHRFNGTCLLNSLTAAIMRHVVIRDHLALIVSLWIIHTHVIYAARFSPLLAITWPGHGTGKATLLTVLGRLCRMAYRTMQISPSGLLRMVRKYYPTMLFDDGDSMFRGAAFLAILNAAHDRSTGGITVATKHDDYEAMGTLFAKAIKLHAGLPESLLGRSIEIQLQPKRPDEVILPLAAYGTDVNDEMTALHAQLLRWAEDHLSDLKAVAPSPRDLGDDRINDTFSPLMAIAEIIGGDVPQRVETAARQLLAHGDSKSEGILLLENINQILTEISNEKIFSIELVGALCARSDWRWATCNKGRPLDQLLLAKMLFEYGMEPTEFRIKRVKKRGYYVRDIRDAFTKYLPNAEQDVK